jgi:hypothetical protein
VRRKISTSFPIRLLRICGDSPASFSPEEFPYDPTDPVQLAEGANFRLETSLGAIDIMQWVAGIETDLAYNELSPARLPVTFRDTQVHVCSLKHLRAMKRAAGRPQDIEDLRRLGED